MESSGFLKVLLVFLVLFASTVSAGDNPDKEACMKMSRGMLKKFMKMYNTCNKELGMLNKTAKEYTESLGCVIKCVMKKSNILDSEELVSEEIMKKQIESHVPESYRKHAHEGLMKCVKLHDDLNPKDPKCATYLKLGNCMQEGLVDLCGEMPII